MHMNGRVYDPVLGRFISADPTVQYPDSTQGLNRYTYVNNNPLSLTDPSGFGFFHNIGHAISRAFKSIGHFFEKNWRSIAAVAITALAVATGVTSYGDMILFNEFTKSF